MVEFIKRSKRIILIYFEKMKKEIIEKISVLITTAFGLVAALAWNGAIRALFARIFGTTEGLGPMMTYAIVVTIIAVVATIWIGKIAEKVKES